jgi:hypothetical protein
VPYALAAKNPSTAANIQIIEAKNPMNETANPQ